MVCAPQVGFPEGKRLQSNRLTAAGVCLMRAMLKAASSRHSKESIESAYIQSTGETRADPSQVQDGEPGLAAVSAAARRLHARLHADPEKAEFGTAQGGARPAYERN